MLFLLKKYICNLTKLDYHYHRLYRGGLMRLRENLRLLRKQAGLTQVELAKKLHMKQYAISDYELGRIEPTLQALSNIADYFHVSVDFLLGRKSKDISNENNISSYIQEVQVDKDLLAFYEEIKTLTPKEKKKLVETIKFVKATYFKKD